MSGPRDVYPLVLLLATIVPLSASRCSCHHPEKGDQTRCGGNEMVVEVPEKHYRELSGVIKLGSDTSQEVLVEIFDNPEYLLHKPLPNGNPKQKRLRACVTSEDGSFCFRNLPSGKYELRASLSAGIDVTHVYAVVDTKNGSKEPIEVSLHVGT
jgi:hypothetical protein